MNAQVELNDRSVKVEQVSQGSEPTMTQLGKEGKA